LMLILLLTLATLRVSLSLGGKRAPNSFAPDGADVSPFSNRLCRSHANAYEGFPIFGGLMLLSVALDVTSITDSLALYLLGARVLQSLTHLVSTSNLAVQARFAFFVVQVVIAIWWVVQFAKM
jgi:hypothetical protein